MNNADIRKNSFKCVLHIAARKGYLEIVKALLDKGTDINATNYDGDTALNEAAGCGRLEVVQFLLDKGASFEARNEEGCTALHIACEVGCLGIVKALLEKGSDVNVVSEKNGDTPLHESARMNCYNIVEYLVEEEKATIDVKNLRGETPSDLADSNGYKDIVKYLSLRVRECPKTSGSLADDKNVIQYQKVTENKHLTITNRAIKTSFCVGIMTMLTSVAIGCTAIHLSLSISATAALIVGAIAGGITYAVLKPNSRLNECEVNRQSLPQMPKDECCMSY
ncbi:ankyrin repeat domain-containing protein [Wolbachia endosymbiont (group A) of Paraperithous gnathaulax]